MRLVGRFLQVADTINEVTDELTDATTLALLMEGIEEIRRTLAIVNDDLKQRLAFNMKEKTLETQFGTFERIRNKKRTDWDPEIRPRTLAQLLTDEGLVEPEKSLAVAKHLLEELPFTPGAPRTTKIEAMGYDPSEWCNEVDSGYSVKSTTNRAVIRKKLKPKA